MEQELAVFGLDSFMDTITYVTDRGANFVKAFRSNQVLLCVVHRMNNILKRCFFQNPSKKLNHSPGKSLHTLTSLISMEKTPVKVKGASNVSQSESPETEENDADENEDES